MTAILEHYTRRKISDMTEDEISEEWAKLVYVLEWQTKQTDMSVPNRN